MNKLPERITCRYCDWTSEITEDSIIDSNENFDVVECRNCHARNDVYRILKENPHFKKHLEGTWLLDLGEVTDEFKNCNSLSSSNVSISDDDNNGERLPDHEYEGLENPIWDK